MYPNNTSVLNTMLCYLYMYTSVQYPTTILQTLTSKSHRTVQDIRFNAMAQIKPNFIPGIHLGLGLGLGQLTFDNLLGYCIMLLIYFKSFTKYLMTDFKSARHQLTCFSENQIYVHTMTQSFNINFVSSQKGGHGWIGFRHANQCC